MLNQTHLEHAIIALIIQVVAMVAWAMVGWKHGEWAGAGMAIAAFIAREHAQREYQITHGGPVNGLKPWEGFFGWTTDAKLDVIAPAVAVCVVALLIDNKF